MAGYRIAMVSDWYYPKVGGIEYAIYSLARGLSRRGHSVEIITRRYPAGFGVKPPEIDGVEVIRVGRPSLNRILSPKAYVELYGVLRRGNYDIIHAHALDSPMSLFSIIAGKLLDIPVVVTNHSLVGSSKLRPFLLAGGKVFLSFTKAVIAVSSAVARETEQMTDAPLYVIPNGIDFKPEPRGSNAGELVIGTVSRITKKKGVDEFVEIACELVKERKNLKFVVVGDGPLREKLERRIREKGLSDRFKFTGLVPREKVLEVLEGFDIFVMPSRDEAFGVAVLEAMGKGIPVVARNHSGVSDIVSHGVTGFLADTRDEMRKYVERLIENQKLRESLSARAVETCRRYSWEEICRRVERVYGDVLNGCISER